MKGTLDDVSQADAVKRASTFTQDLGKKAEDAARKVGSAAENVSKTGAFQKAAQTAQTVREEIEGNSLGGQVYRYAMRGLIHCPLSFMSVSNHSRAPSQLRKRKEYSRDASQAAPIEANEDATGVELHKDSK